MTIGNRAVEEIKAQARKNGITLCKEAEKIGINRKTLVDWRNNINPSAYFLQQMALAGYDIHWILIGGKNEENQ